MMFKRSSKSSKSSKSSTKSKSTTSSTQVSSHTQSSATNGQPSNELCEPVVDSLREKTSGPVVNDIENGLLECPLCLLQLPVECFPVLSGSQDSFTAAPSHPSPIPEAPLNEDETKSDERRPPGGRCGHIACFECLQKYVSIEINESRIILTCPQCPEPLHPNDIRLVAKNEILMGKYEQFMLRRVLMQDPDSRWCPAVDCDFVVIAAGCASCPRIKCQRPGCGTHFCYHCKQEWHPNQTCDAARAQRSGRSGRDNGRALDSDSTIINLGPSTSNPGKTKKSTPRSGPAAMISSALERVRQNGDSEIKPCPCCQVLIVKMDDGSCNHMTCSVCGTEFCWLCMKEVSDLHYLSPSGCTFWGKKPWSRKKKIMWQLGMLVGAPVGIALIAGIAVPAIIIGFPVWVGRKLHTRFEKKTLTNHKKNLLIASGVLSSMLVSPVLAAVAVGIGVPILLAYVYGVVPISLCRSGGCGVVTSASGVRFEFDEDNVNSAPPVPDGISVDTAPSHKAANPSIGEVSIGLMSTSMSVGSSSPHVGSQRHAARDDKMRGRGTVSQASVTTFAGAGSSSIETGQGGHQAYNIDNASNSALAGSVSSFPPHPLPQSYQTGNPPASEPFDPSHRTAIPSISMSSSSSSSSAGHLVTAVSAIINPTH